MDLIAIHEIHFGVKPGTDKTPPTIKIVSPGEAFECSESEGAELVKMGAARINTQAEPKAEKPKAEKPTAEKPKAEKPKAETPARAEGSEGGPEGGSKDGGDDGEDMV